MSQEIRTQVFDGTTTSGGNLSFPASGFYPTEHLTGLLVSAVITSAAPATIAANTKRADGSSVPLFSGATPAVGTHWEFSLGDYLNSNPLTSTAYPIFLPPFVQIVITGATTSVVRLTVWSVKLSG